jgi:outer membrane protein assembly factor BamB
LRRAPIVVVVVLATTIFAAAASKWEGRVLVPARGGVETGYSHGPHPAGPAPALSTNGMGAGPPPALAPATRGGARMLHGNSRHTGRAAAYAVRERPTLAWSHEIGGPIEAQIVASPDERTLYVASLGASLTALDRDNGATRWVLSLGDRSYATPCVADDGTVYAGSDSKRFFSVNPDGKINWTLDTDGEADTGPAIAPDGTVVFAAGRMVYGVTALGRVSWRFAAKRKVFSSVAIADNGRIFFGSQDHHAYALSPGGEIAWTVDLGADSDGAAAIDDSGAVFFGTDSDEIVRLDPEDGHVVWRAPIGGFVRGPLSIARDGDVLAGVYGPTPREVRLSAKDGSIRGQFAVQGTGAREFGLHGAALEDQSGALLFGAQDDRLYAIDERGNLMWQFATGGDVDAPVTLLSDGTAIFGSDDGVVYALRPR